MYEPGKEMRDVGGASFMQRNRQQRLKTGTRDGNLSCWRTARSPAAREQSSDLLIEFVNELTR